MKRGKTEVETIKLNGWGPGDILEGQEGNKTDRILIVSMGDEKFVAKWDFRATGEYDRESGNFTLSRREWRKVGRIDEPPAWDGEGLPPVGCECEVMAWSKWHRVIVTAIGEDMMLIKYMDSTGQSEGTILKAADFRPIRSEEDRAVEEMYEAATGDPLEGDEMDDADAVSVCRELYRAGYRKTGGEG